MLNLQTRIDKVKEYFRGIEYTSGLFIVKVEYKPKWNVFQPNGGSISVTVDDNIPNLYYYYGDSTIDYNDFFDLIDETIKFNMEAEDKVALMREKYAELKELFVNEDLETLKTLTFTLKKKKPKKVKPKVEKVEEESVLENKEEAEVVEVEEVK